MAKGRIICNDVSLDPELNTLSVEAHLCYLLAFTHLDRDGLIDAHPNKLWATICPLRTEFFDRMPQIVDEWIRTGRVLRYACGDGRSTLFFKDFRRYNVRLKYTNEATSTFPPPPGWVRSKVGLIPADPELRERMAANYDGRSQYRAELEAHLTGSMSRHERDVIATLSPVSRPQDQGKDDLEDDGDQIIHSIHPRNGNRGGMGGKIMQWGEIRKEKAIAPRGANIAKNTIKILIQPATRTISLSPLNAVRLKWPPGN
ncbi:MAG: hypothetical protein R3E79_23875 [Caldilineaceae bacterium]